MFLFFCQIIHQRVMYVFVFLSNNSSESNVCFSFLSNNSSESNVCFCFFVK